MAMPALALSDPLRDLGGLPLLQDMSEQEFRLIQRLVYERAGISFNGDKKPLVAGRLWKRLRHFGLASYEAYYQLLMGDAAGGELQTAIDLLTTNETYFFREPKHFEFLRQAALRHGAGNHRPFRVWSAACSSGEEVYSIAMVLAEVLGLEGWELLGSDIGSHVLARARHGHYPLDRIDNIPPGLLRRYCLKGVGAHAGTFLVDQPLRRSIRFEPINLNAPLPALGEFDIIFLRNVMLYFDGATKQKVVERLLPSLRAHGHLLIGHSETLNGVTNRLKAVRPSIYRNGDGPHL